MICCLMPNYNNAQYIIEAVESVLTQSYKDPADIVIVDDGSTDDSIATVKQYLSDKPEYSKRIHIIPQSNGGPSKARNTGLEYILGRKYEYVILLDSDDFLYSNFLEECMNLMEGYPEITAVYGDYDIKINVDNIAPFCFREYKQSLTNESLWIECLMPHQALVRTRAFRDVLKNTGGLYDAELRVMNDYDMDLKLAMTGVLWHHPKVMGVVREGINNSCAPIQGRIRQECEQRLRQNNASNYVY